MSGSAARAAPKLKDLTLAELREHIVSRGLPRFRADQIAAWVYTRGVEDPEAMTDLDLDLRRGLHEEFDFSSLEMEEVAHSKDGTIKGILRADDGALVEAVLIPEEDRLTLCVSSQVGCALACSFCATGKMGFTRNLRAGEIIDQFCRMRALVAPDRRITNVVFMGMGEPLLNLDAVGRAISLLLDPKAFALAPRRVTVSTAGLVPKIVELCETLPVNLAVSLHAARDELRDQLVPLNRKFPLADLFETLRRLPRLSRRHPVFFEYTLLAGVNSEEDARDLVRLLGDLPAKLNVIPVNPHPGSPYGIPEPATIDRFMGVLARGGLTTTLRRSRGPDIGAACGQLALRRLPSQTPPGSSDVASRPASERTKHA